MISPSARLRPRHCIWSNADARGKFRHQRGTHFRAHAAQGISISIIGGPGWEPADDWAALAASIIIFYNGVNILRPAISDLMDHAPETTVRRLLLSAAESVEGVQATEKLKVRKAGIGFYVDIHVQADPGMSLHDAHILSGRVKSAMRAAVPAVLGVIVHMEPFGNRPTAEQRCRPKD